MSTRKNFKRARMVPNPIGTPPIEFVPFIFGKVKPIPFIPNSITLIPTFRTYAQVLIPKNTFGINKILKVGFYAQVITNAPNQIGGPNYTEQYDMPLCGITQRLAAFNIPVVPANTVVWIEREFSFNGAAVIELNYNGPNALQSISHVDNLIHILSLSIAINAFNPSVDNYLNFQASTSFPLSTDQVICLWGQAFIQSPLDLRRLVS